VVATRSLAASNRFAPGSLLHTLGVRTATAANLVDLDDDHYFDPDGLREFAAALLRQDGATTPTPPDGAWRIYRADRPSADRLAVAIAARAGRNHLVAALTADALSQGEEAVDPANRGSDLLQLPSSVGEALAKYFDRQPAAEWVRVRALLTALAYARGSGTDDPLWIAFAQRLGYPASVVDLDTLRGTATADYLLHMSRGQGGPVTRLFHQALADELLSTRDSRHDEHQLLAAQVPTPPATWTDTTSYAHMYTADHAAAAGQLADLLADAGYALVADLDRLLPLLPAQPTAALAPIVAVLRTAGGPARTLLP
jgi:hypothetical protein